MSVADLARSALSSGHLPPGSFWPFYGYRGHGAIWRTSIMRAHLVRAPRTQPVVPAEAYRLLEPTERAFVSGFMGSAVAHQFAQRHLGLNWLLHVSAYAVAFRTRFNTSLRPDFIAPMINNRWAVLEAKGRQRLQSATMTHAKEQTESIRSINGVKPVLRVVCVAVFRSAGLRVELQDPPPEPIDLLGTIGEVVTEYYKPVTELLEGGSAGEVRSVDGHPYLTTRVDALDLTIGLRFEVTEALASGNGDPTSLAIVDGLSASWSDGDFSVGPDGVLVVLGESWRESQ